MDGELSAAALVTVLIVAALKRWNVTGRRAAFASAAVAALVVLTWTWSEVGFARETAFAMIRDWAMAWSAGTGVYHAARGEVVR